MSDCECADSKFQASASDLEFLSQRARAGKQSDEDSTLQLINPKTKVWFSREIWSATMSR